jgi:hypothetical protein
MSIINFDEEVKSGVLAEIDMETALKVVNWIQTKSLTNRRGKNYEVEGNPVLDKADAVSIKATFVHNKWCDKDARLSKLAWDNNADAYVFIAWGELLELAGFDNGANAVEEVDV